jgi:hypothetical protein
MGKRAAMKRVTARVLAMMVLAGTVGVAACEDSPRPLNYTPGVYKGKPDTPLSEETVQALRQRAAYQGKATSIVGSGRSVEQLSNRSYVRPHEESRERAARQSEQ